LKRRQPFVHFCEQVLRLELSPAWRVLLTVAVDGIEPRMLSGEDRKIAKVLFGSINFVPELARRTLVFRLGRGSGKTTIAAAIGLWAMLTSPLDAVGPGMVPASVTVAPRRPTARISVGVARELVRRVPALERLVNRDGDTADGFVMTRPTDRRRVSFVAVAASRGGHSLRGFDIITLIIDESEFLTSNLDAADASGYQVSDRDLFAAAKPRLHGVAILISTPWPVENLTDELFTKNFDDPSTALAAIGPSTFMRPDDERLAHDAAQELVRDEENAHREYWCIPGPRGGSRMFDAELVDAAVVPERALMVYAPRNAILGCGGDLGLERDSSAICVVGRVPDGRVELLEFDEVRPSKGHPLTPKGVVVGRFGPVMQRHHVTSIALDGHYRRSAEEHLDSMQLRMVEASSDAQFKYDTHMHLRDLLRSSNLVLPPAPRLIAQMKAVTSAPMPGGGTKITSPRRAGMGHGDILSALVLAAWMAASGRARELSPEIKALMQESINRMRNPPRNDLDNFVGSIFRPGFGSF
jgi:hypothetical protein